MSGDPEHDDRTETNFSRRTFMKASGGVAGAGLLGVGGANGAAAATDGDVDERFLNWRTVEARKVWERGYRGRADRSLALTDSGVAVEHPELGPWNDVLAEKDGEDLVLKTVSTTTEQQPITESVPVDSESFTGTQAAPPGFLVRTYTHDFLVPDLSITPETTRTETFGGSGAGLLVGTGATTSDFAVPGDVDESQFDGEVLGYRVDATLTWEPSAEDEDAPEPTRADFELRDSDGNTVESSDQGLGATNTSSETYRRIVADVEPGDYRFFAYANRGVNEWRVEAEVQVVTDAARADDLEDVVGYEVAGEVVANETTGSGADVEVILRDEAGDAVASAGTGGGANADFAFDATPGQYRFEVVTTSDVSDWSLETSINTVRKKRDGDGDLVYEDQQVVTTSPFDGDPIPDVDEPTADTPKTIGWYTRSDRYTSSLRPTDPNGHGSHVSGIMAGSGRASSIDLENTRVEKPGAVLLPTDFVEYDVTAGAGTTVFASAFGEGIKVEIVGPDGEVIHEAPLRGDSIVADEPARHGSGTATYTVRVRPLETATPSDDLPGRVIEGNPGVARLDRIAVGTYRPPGTTTGARTELADGEQAVHPGIAPNQSLVGLTGLVQPTDDLGDIADDLAELFNVRAVNMSWGPGLGLPIGQFGGRLDPVWDPIFAGDIDSTRTLNAIEFAAKNGILTVAAAGNSFTPANGNGFPAIADEAISVAATGPLDGITSYSSGGIGGVDEDDSSEQYFKPDVTAPGGDLEPDVAGYLAARTADDELPFDVSYPVPSRKELVRSVMAPGSGYDDNPVDGDPPRDHVSVGGTSMASPYVCGVTGLVAQAMEEDAPESIRLPEPAELAAMDDAAALQWTMRLKQVVLATANETAFTAAPYHNAKTVPSTPTYQHGGRDPYEGYGRANPDAAVDAVSRDLFDGETFELGGDGAALSHAESVGTYVPEDSRAVAGYVTVPGGTLDVSVDFTGYSGANDGLARGDPHLDLFVYDAENPAANGEPAIVASTQAEQGSGSVSVDVDRGTREDPTERTFFVVAKIVNVPGVVNGYDVQANFDLGVSFTPADAFPQPAFSATGTRSVGSTVMGGREVTRVDVDVEDLAGEARVYDHIPDGWTLLEAFSDAATVADEQGKIRLFHRETRTGEPDDEDTYDSSASFTYFVESPDQLQDTGAYTFGPGLAEAVDADEWDPAEAEYAGTDDAVVAGVDL